MFFGLGTHIDMGEAKLTPISVWGCPNTGINCPHTYLLHSGVHELGSNAVVAASTYCLLKSQGRGAGSIEPFLFTLTQYIVANDSWGSRLTPHACHSPLLLLLLLPPHRSG